MRARGGLRLYVGAVLIHALAAVAAGADIVYVSGLSLKPRIST
jgi:NAD(P)H-hydrate repair Nnr-like enzyme with NAD(P)H-hydrate dehydratase domain